MLQQLEAGTTKLEIQNAGIIQAYTSKCREHDLCQAEINTKFARLEKSTEMLEKSLDKTTEKVCDIIDVKGRIGKLDKHSTSYQFPKTITFDVKKIRKGSYAEINIAHCRSYREVRWKIIAVYQQVECFVANNLEVMMTALPRTDLPCWNLIVNVMNSLLQRKHDSWNRVVRDFTTFLAPVCGLVRSGSSADERAFEIFTKHDNLESFTFSEDDVGGAQQFLNLAVREWNQAFAEVQKSTIGEKFDSSEQNSVEVDISHILFDHMFFEQLHSAAILTVGELWVPSSSDFFKKFDIVELDERCSYFSLQKHTFSKQEVVDCEKTYINKSNIEQSDFMGMGKFIWKQYSEDKKALQPEDVVLPPINWFGHEEELKQPFKWTDDRFEEFGSFCWKQYLKAYFCKFKKDALLKIFQSNFNLGSIPKSSRDDDWMMYFLGVLKTSNECQLYEDWVQDDVIFDAVLKAYKQTLLDITAEAKTTFISAVNEWITKKVADAKLSCLVEACFMTHEDGQRDLEKIWREFLEESRLDASQMNVWLPEKDLMNKLSNAILKEYMAASGGPAGGHG